MTLLQGSEIRRRFTLVDSERLYTDPLLEDAQIGEVSIDLRVGPDFLVSLLTRSAYIDIVGDDRRGVSSYFRTTRREVGDTFVLYPNQVVLATTLEYVGLPDDVYADITTRSSYSRLGIHLSTMIQPGFRGCFPLELTNQGNNPVAIVVGSRIVQARLFLLGAASGYQAGTVDRKYLGNVRPVVSRAPEDTDLRVLKAME
jgi:dCTP deaminase